MGIKIVEFKPENAEIVKKAGVSKMDNVWIQGEVIGQGRIAESQWGGNYRYLTIKLDCGVDVSVCSTSKKGKPLDLGDWDDDIKRFLGRKVRLSPKIAELYDKDTKKKKEKIFGLKWNGMSKAYTRGNGYEVPSMYQFYATDQCVVDILTVADIALQNDTIPTGADFDKAVEESLLTPNSIDEDMKATGVEISEEELDF